ncbi:MAG: helix-turn-helix transcriptional regulator [Flavobacteriales bacterium]|nr:helix-turn-helix transcriptional regulator [Flavobacteriaceae bacterium]MBL6873788.1 helix-turn-helix transcriptional regulator [Flavobacteriales bacterium]
MIGLYTSPLFTSILPARVGYIIQQKRKQLGLTQKELAGKTRFSKYMISKIERGILSNDLFNRSHWAKS